MTQAERIRAKIEQLEKEIANGRWTASGQLQLHQTLAILELALAVAENKPHSVYGGPL